MKYFLDNCLSPHLTKALRKLDSANQITHLREKFPADISDVDWLAALSTEGEWVIVSGDVRIHRNPHNRAAWRESRLTGFFFKKGFTALLIWEQAWRMVRWWPLIINQAQRVQSGVGFLVPRDFNGKFELIERP